MSESNSNPSNNNHDRPREWVRGVNIGGWLLAENFISPYLFAVNSCHLQGSLCVYPGQIGLDDRDDSVYAPNGEAVHYCDPNICKPELVVRAKEPTDYHLIKGLPGSSLGINDSGMQYPVDEYTLGKLLRSSPGGLDTATKYMERHWDTFLSYDDLKALKQNGVTHLRIPMGYWIRGKNGLSLVDGEPFIPGGWKYFVRAAHWCRELGLTVWADLHGAPGSENGFDNSGRYTGKSTCVGWSEHASRVQRTLDILTDLAHGIVEDGIDDVVTGFGVLNEPFVDCDQDVLRNYYDDAFTILRGILGEDTAVFVGDSFRAYKFNDGEFWLNPAVYHDTYLDSHPYHVFFEQGRSFTPRQHIAYICRHDTQGVRDCCYEDGEAKLVPSQGITRLTGEWSGAYDRLPTALTPQLMKGIADYGILPQMNRTLSPARKAFLRNFVEAQMVAYEAADSGGISSGWLFWNFKME
jgi:glucan 1,3-beta-glucosidase